MHKTLLPFLACPDSGSPLTLVESAEDANGQIVSGRLLAPSGASYPIRDGVPRFVDTDKYVTTFSIQRQHLAKRFEHWTREQGREVRFEGMTSFDLGALKGKLVLDAGIGYGRYAAVVAQTGATVIGVDLSTDSIQLCHRYLGHLPNVHLIHGDLQRLPLRRDLFDAIYSVGVLHHTPDTRRSFEGLLPFVKPGGEIAIWVYAPEDKRFDDVLRLATIHMPSWSVLGVGVVRHVVGQTARRVLLRRKTVKVIEDFWPQVMGQFDSLSPRFAHVHTYGEVESWFRAAGLVDVARGGLRTSVHGRRPGS